MTATQAVTSIRTSPVVPGKACQPSMVTLPPSHAKYNTFLFESGAFSDCTIKCQQKTWKLHRAILAPRCQFFKACFSGSFQESSSLSNEVSMHEDDSTALGSMLRWMYTLEYPSRRDGQSDEPSLAQPQVSKEDNTNLWTSDLDVFAIADKYNLPILMNQARDSLLQTAQATSDPSREEQRELFVKHIDDFVDMVQMLYTTLPDRDDVTSLQIQLLEIVASMVARRMRDHERLEDLMTDVPGFGVMLVETLAAQASEEEKNATMRSSSARSSSSSLLSPMGERRGSGESCGSSRSRGRVEKKYIPMNEDSEDEMD